MGLFFTESEIEFYEKARQPGPDGIAVGCPDWLRALRYTNRPLYIAGIDAGGREALRLVIDSFGKARASGFLVWGDTATPSAMEGLPVRGVRAGKPPGEKPLVLTTAADDASCAKMAQVCRENGYEPLSFQEFRIYRRFPNEGPLYYEANAGKVLEMWADERSRDVYRALIRARVTLDYGEFKKGLSRTEGTQQYFHPRVPADCFRRFSDVGAFDGDTFAAVAAFTGDRFDAYYAFEASATLYSQLVKKVAGDPRVRCWNFAAWDRKTVLRFGEASVESGIGCSKVVDMAGTEVAADRLDTLLDGLPVSMIKMDIEGSEPEALAGAKETILRERPALAISIYHRNAQMWQIPLWLRDLDCGYRFYCGHYSDWYSETICYAVPEKHGV